MIAFARLIHFEPAEEFVRSSDPIWLYKVVVLELYGMLQKYKEINIIWIVENNGILQLVLKIIVILKSYLSQFN